VGCEVVVVVVVVVDGVIIVTSFLVIATIATIAIITITIMITAMLTMHSTSRLFPSLLPYFHVLLSQQYPAASNATTQEVVI
jgi:hypothetical protein